MHKKTDCFCAICRMTDKLKLMLRAETITFQKTFQNTKGAIARDFTHLRQPLLYSAGYPAFLIFETITVISSLCPSILLRCASRQR